MRRFLCPARVVAYAVLVGGILLTEAVTHLLRFHRPEAGMAWLASLPRGVRATGWLAACGLAASIGMVATSRRRAAETARREADLRADALVVRRQRAEVRARSAAIVDQLRRTSHNIRSPLMNILGSIDMLLAQAMPFDAASHLRVVRSNAQHILTLANELLELAASASVPLGERDIDPNAMLAEIAGAFRDRALASGITLALTWETVAPPRLRIDPTRCREILTNLIDNALRHTDAGGVRVVAGYDPAPGILRVCIADTGCGMTPERVATLFDPGARAEATPGRAGVGLVITRHLVEAMGGTIEVASEFGAGSVFTVSVPAAQATAPTARSVRGWGVVLVVDDAPEVLSFMLSALRAQGLSVATAGTAEAALHTIDADPGIGTVLIDLSVADAPALLRRLRESAPPRRVVAFSGDVTPGAEGRAVAEGFDGFLPKPFTDAKLAEALARMPERRAHAA
ncbi:MAG: response regulator [Phycisphaerales bacterium]|nr:response regulator [Phycisphaerales bacterium]